QLFLMVGSAAQVPRLREGIPERDRDRAVRDGTIELPFGVADHAAQEKAVGIPRVQTASRLGGLQRDVPTCRTVMLTCFGEELCCGAGFVGHDGLHLESAL